MMLFISHSGSDTEAASALKQRILDTEAARSSGLRVWLDVDDLEAGREWQPQLEEAIEAATAFCVYLGSKGVVNWVDREVRSGVDRATGKDAIAFIPIRASEAVDWRDLPPFTRQFHGITDPLGDEDALAALLAAVTEGPKAAVVLTDEPFVGLHAMGEREADRFFGRDGEIAALAASVKAHRITAVIADSGAGKSSLVRAGLIPEFRGGALAGREHTALSRTRHVVVMRPGADPIQGLRDGIDRAARRMGLTSSERRSIRRGVEPSDPGETAYALCCDLPPDETDCLLVVDQFEELLTQSDRTAAEAFVGLMLALADPAGDRNIRIVLTARADYYNLIRRHQALFERLEADEGAAQLRLKRISADGLSDVVHRPLAMAGNRDQQERDALLAAIRRDTPDRPGDLALVQMALYATWRRAKREGIGLLRAYSDVHGVLGALAFEAERARREVLTAEERELLLPLFARLVQLGETGGATRRIADLAELDPSRADLARKLATEEAGRLLMISEQSVEVAHEALVAQWPWLQEQIQSCAGDIRSLARLGDQTGEWIAAGCSRSALPNDAERRAYEDLAERRPDWLSDGERDLIGAAKRKRALLMVAAAMAVLLIVIGGIASTFFAIKAETEAARALAAEKEARDQAERAREQASNARQKEIAATEAGSKAATFAAGFLSSLAKEALEKGDAANAAKFALAAWPRDSNSMIPTSRDTFETLAAATPMLRDSGSQGAEPWMACGPHGKAHVVVQSEGSTAVFNIASGKETSRHGTFPSFPNLVFSRDGAWYATGSYQDVGRLVDGSGNQMTNLAVDENESPTVVALSHDEEKLAVGDIDRGRIHLWDPAAHRSLKDFSAEAHQIGALGLSPNGHQIVVYDRGQGIRIWDTRTAKEVAALEIPTAARRPELVQVGFTTDGRVIFAVSRAGILVSWDAQTLEPRLSWNAGWDSDTGALPVANNGSLIAMGGDAGEITVIDLPSGEPSGELRGHRSAVSTIAFSADGQRLASGDSGGTVRIWNLESGTEAARYELPYNSIRCVTFLPTQHRIAVFSDHGPPTIWTPDENSDVTWQNLPLSSPGDVSAFSAAARYLVTASAAEKVPASPGRGVALFDTTDLSRIDELADREEIITSVAVSDDGTLIAIGMRAVAEVWRRATKETLVRFDLDPHHDVTTLAFSDDNQRLAIGVAYDGETKVLGGLYAEVVKARLGGLWLGEIASGRMIRASGSLTDKPLHFAMQALEDVVFVPGRSEIVQLERGSAPGLVATDPDGARAPLRRPLSWIRQGGMGKPGRLAISRDSRLLVTAGPQDLRLWDVATGAEISGLVHGGGQTPEIAFRGDNTLLSLSPDGRLGTWDLSWIADGSYFNIVCGLLPNHRFGQTSEEYKITIDEPVCGDGYDPPLPAPE